jgi:hypothetical protein
VTAVIRVGQADDALSLMKERKWMWMGRDSGMGQSYWGMLKFCYSYLDIYQDTRVLIIHKKPLHVAFRCQTPNLDNLGSWKVSNLMRTCAVFSTWRLPCWRLRRSYAPQNSGSTHLVGWSPWVTSSLC